MPLISPLMSVPLICRILLTKIALTRFGDHRDEKSERTEKQKMFVYVVSERQNKSQAGDFCQQ